MASVYPCKIIVVWIRPYNQPRRRCWKCKQRDATFAWEDYTDSMHIFSERVQMAVINVYAAWDRAAHEQAHGIYNRWETRYECDECTLKGMALIIGRPRDAIANVITRGKDQASQHEVEHSFVVFQTVDSYKDDGTSHIAPVPNTTIEEVASIMSGY
jgi:hypothetical protein